MDEGEENKGRIVRRRRSSILKLPLAGIDPNKQIKLKQKEIKKRRSSKRVSFAETLDVWEFNKESQSENSDKNAFRNQDDSAKEISGIDSLLTGEIKNPAPAIEIISDPEDSCDEGENTTLNCNEFRSPENEFLVQNEVANANKENINIVVPGPVINTNSSDISLSPANQSIYCPPDFDNESQKLDKMSAFQQLMQKIKTPLGLSEENSPVAKVAAPRSMSTKMFLDNLLKSTKDETSFSDGILGSTAALPDSSMETSASASPALDKSLYYTESPKQADTTIYFNRNPDQTASMDFTICNSKVFSDSFKIESPAVNSPSHDDMTVYFGPNQTQFANMDLTACHGQLLSGCSRIVPEEDSSNQKMATPMDVTRIFNETKDIMANMDLTQCSIQNPISFLDFNKKPSVRTETKAEPENTAVNMELTQISTYPIIAKQIVTEDAKENVPPSVPLYSVDTKQDKSFKGNCSLNSDQEKRIPLKAGPEDLAERSTGSASFLELPVPKANQIPDVENPGSINLLKKSVKKRVSFMCPEEHQPAMEPCLLGEDEPPIKKLNSGNQVDLYSQNSGSTDAPPQVPFKDPPEKSTNFIQEVLMSKTPTKSGVKRVSFYDPEEVLGKNSVSDCRNELPVANISLTKSAAEKVESTDPVAKRAASTYLDEPFTKKPLLENVLEKSSSSSPKTFFPESTKGASSNLESDTTSQQTTSTDNKALGSLKSLYLSLNTSGILKSFDVDDPKCESVHENLPKSVGKQVSFLFADEEMSTGRKVLEERNSKVTASPYSQAGSVETVSVEKDLTTTAEKRVSFLPTAEKSLEKKTSDITRANTDPQSTTSLEERNKCLYISLNSSGILKSFANVEDYDQPMDKTLTKTPEKRGTPCPADEQLSCKSTMDVTKSVAEPQLAKSPEGNKYMSMSLNNSGILKSLGSNENCPPGQSVDHGDWNKSAKRATFRSANDGPSGQRSGGVDQSRLPTSVVPAKRLFRAPEPSGSSPDPGDNEPTLTRLKEGVSPTAEKVTLAKPVIQEDSNREGKEADVQVGGIAEQVNPDAIPKAERLAANRASLAKVPNFKNSWQGMFSIQNVIKNVKRNRSGAVPAAPCEPTTKTAAMSALSIMRPMSVPESTHSRDPFPPQDKGSVAQELKEKKTKNTFLNMVDTNKLPSESKATGITMNNLLSSQLPSQDVKVAKTSPPKASEDNSIIYDLNFKLEDLTGIMNEQSDILIENSHYESTAHLLQNQLSSSTVNNTRPSFSNKSVDDVKNSILALSSINSSLCSRMLINMHMPSLEKNLSSVEVDSIEELLLLVGIDKLENVSIDYRRSSVDLAPVRSEGMALGERLLMFSLEQPKYQSILQAYDSLKAKEQTLLTEFHSQKLLEDFQLAVKKKEESKSNDELKNQLIEDFKKCKQSSQQKGKKQRKADRYVNLCSVLRGKLVVMEEAKSELDNISQKLDQQLEGLDQVLDTLDKELEQMDSFPDVTDEDLEQYSQVKKYLDDADTIHTQEQKLSNQCSQLREQEKSLKDEYSSLLVAHTNLLKPFSLDTSALLKNCQTMKMYSVILPWRVCRLEEDQQKYSFWNDTFQLCIHTQAEHIKKAHFELDENWQSVAKYHPWQQIAHEMRQNVMSEKSFLEGLRHTSQLPELLHGIGNLLNSLQDLAKEIHAVSLRNVITRKHNSILVTYCCLLSKIQVCFQFDPSNYPTATINHQVNVNYGNVRCADISRKLRRIKPGGLYLSRLVDAFQLESVSSPL